MNDAGQTAKPSRAREMAVSEHAVRNSIATRERRWSLGPDAMEWREEARQGEIPYRDVKAVRLTRYASYGGAQFQCTLRLRAGGKQQIRSHHYSSLGKFEDRSASYGPFVRELARRVANHAPDAAFIAGSSALWFTWLFIMLLWGIVAIPLLVLMATGAAPAGVLWLLVLGVIAAPLAWRQLRRGRAKAFDPADPPRDLLGN